MKAVRRYLFAALTAAWMVGPAAADELTVGLAVEATSMDPHYQNLIPNRALHAHIYSPLVDQDEIQRLIPGLAVSWKPISETEWEFKLRPNVKFHDGSPFTADDVIFTFERAGNVPNSPSSFGLYTKGKTVTKVDDLTVRMKTASPAPLLPNDISAIFVISKKNAEGATTGAFNQGRAAIGTGPYKLGKSVPGEGVVLERFEDYWGEKPAFQKVTMKAIPSEPARTAALLAGDVGLIERVPMTDVERLRKDANIVLRESAPSRFLFLHLDRFRDRSPFVTGVEESPLLKLKVRQAMSAAINREAIVSRVMEGIATPASQVMHDTFFGVSPNLKADKFDPERAKALLTEAGYPNGFGLTLHSPAGRYDKDVQVAQAVAQMFTRVGIRTKVETLPSGVFFSRASTGGANGTPEFSLILSGWGSDTGETSSPLRSLLMTYDQTKGNGASNRGRFSNAEVDATIEKAMATFDDDARAKLLARATEIAIGDLGIIPLYYQPSIWAARKGLKYTPRTDEKTLVTGAARE